MFSIIKKPQCTIINFQLNFKVIGLSSYLLFAFTVLTCNERPIVRHGFDSKLCSIISNYSV